MSSLDFNASRHFDVMLYDQIQAGACSVQTLPAITCEVTVFAKSIQIKDANKKQLHCDYFNSFYLISVVYIFHIKVAFQ